MKHSHLYLCSHHSLCQCPCHYPLLLWTPLHPQSLCLLFHPHDQSRKSLNLNLSLLCDVRCWYSLNLYLDIWCRYWLISCSRCSWWDGLCLRFWRRSPCKSDDAFDECSASFINDKFFKASRCCSLDRIIESIFFSRVFFLWFSFESSVGFTAWIYLYIS